MRAGGRFELDLARYELLLTREFDLETTFDEMQLAIRRLARVASRWHLMRPARITSNVLRLLPSLLGKTP